MTNFAWLMPVIIAAMIVFIVDLVGNYIEFNNRFLNALVQRPVLSAVVFGALTAYFTPTEVAITPVNPLGQYERQPRRGRFATGRLTRRGAYPIFRPQAPVAELVDAANSKSVARKSVLVRVRPGAPLPILRTQGLPQRKLTKSAPVHQSCRERLCASKNKQNILLGGAKCHVHPPAAPTQLSSVTPRPTKRKRRKLSPASRSGTSSAGSRRGMCGQAIPTATRS